MTCHELLTRYTSALRRLQHEHELSSRFYEKLSWKLGIPAVVFSAAAGATIFSAKAGSNMASALWIPGVLSLLAAFASAVQTFLDCEQRSLNHKIAAGKFGELVSQSELASVRKLEDEACCALLTDIHSKWNSVRADAPSLRASMIREINSLEVPLR